MEGHGDLAGLGRFRKVYISLRDYSSLMRVKMSAGVRRILVSKRSRKAGFLIGVYVGISMVLFTFLAAEGFTSRFFIGAIVVSLEVFVLYLNVQVGEHYGTKNRHCYPYFWTMTFALGSVFGLLSCFIVEAKWNIYLGAVTWAAIGAFAHLINDEFRMDKKMIGVKNLSYERQRLYVEWLKVEHDCAQNQFQVFISLLGLVVVGGIAAYFISQNSVWSPGMYKSVLVVVWGVIGLWFGILSPLQSKMHTFRDEMRRIVGSPWDSACAR